jgi:alpha,alpha-trehalose phosphorylase
VIKQADVVLATYLVGHEFSPEHKRANFVYYDRLTTGDSSLAASVQRIVAAEVGGRGHTSSHRAQDEKGV